MKNNTRKNFSLIKQDFEEKVSQIDTNHNDSMLNMSKIDTESMKVNKSISEQDFILNNGFYRNKIKSKIQYKHGFRPTFMGGLYKLPLSTTQNKLQNLKKL